MSFVNEENKNETNNKHKTIVNKTQNRLGRVRHACRQERKLALPCENSSCRNPVWIVAPRNRNNKNENTILWMAPFKVESARKPKTKSTDKANKLICCASPRDPKRMHRRKNNNIERRLSQYVHFQDVETWFQFGIHPSVHVFKHVDRKPNVRNVHFDT